MRLIPALLVVAFTMLFWHIAHAGDWSNSPNHAWYEAQQPTPETLKAYKLAWKSCCDSGDVCQECVIYRVQDKPPWKDGWYYMADGVLHQMPNHIVEYVPWTPTGKPVLFVAPFDSGDIKKGTPVCLKVPGGGT